MLRTEPLREVAVCSSVQQLESKPNEPSCLSVSAFSACVIVIVCTFIVLSRDYIKYVLISLEHSGVVISFVVFLMLFTAVSFPFTWGYILLNIAAGYLYGLAGGIFIIISCATIGITLAHITIRKFFGNLVRTRLVSSSMRHVINVVESEHGFKVIVLARLTPIPFGLQNALFAMSDISLQRYIAASASGMLPCQSLHAYIGSTLRSMEEVVASSSSSTAAYIVFSVQVVMVFTFLAFVVSKARNEFSRTVEQARDDALLPASTVPSESKFFGYGFVTAKQTDELLVA